jgi:hypothetical protein
MQDTDDIGLSAKLAEAHRKIRNDWLERNGFYGVTGDAFVRMMACTRCGAVVAIKMTDDVQADLHPAWLHREFHKKLDAPVTVAEHNHMYGADKFTGGVNKVPAEPAKKKDFAAYEPPGVYCDGGQ